MYKKKLKQILTIYFLIPAGIVLIAGGAGIWSLREAAVPPASWATSTYAAQEKALRLFFSIALLSAAFSLNGGIRAVNRISLPVQKAVEAAGQLSRGAIPADLSFRGCAELQMLSFFLGRIAENTRDQAAFFTELAQANFSLESAPCPGNEAVNEAAARYLEWEAKNLRKIRKHADGAAHAIELLHTGLQEQAERAEERMLGLTAAFELAALLEQGGRDCSAGIRDACRENKIAPDLENAVCNGKIAERALDSVCNYAGDIREVVEQMNLFAHQTDILALNASIEAAGAGPRGAALAVIAGEIRVLAEKNREAAADAEKLLRACGEQAQKAARAMGQGMCRLHDALDHTVKAGSLLEQAFRAGERQEARSGELSGRLERIRVEAHESMADKRKMTASAEELAMHMELLGDVIRQYRVHEQGTGPAGGSRKPLLGYQYLPEDES